MHRRRVLHIRPDLWVVVDDLMGTAEHMFDFYFHFPSNAKVSIQQDSGSVLRVNARADSARLQLLMCASAPVTSKTIEGQVDPIQGWVSSTYGEKSRAPVLRVGMQTLAPASGMFIMLPSHSEADPDDAVATRPVPVTQESVLAFEAEHGDVKDIFVSSFHDQPIGIPDFTLHGRFFWLRKTNGCLTHVLGIDCKEVRHGDEILMRDDSGRPHFIFA
jgi:hypothetical protein